ncbi:MAG: hypothetical protein P4L49_01530 [Desulfosporosinus sp.]|nr:hypothetical protein [Desulfosporosinus sp.]
MQLSKWDSPGSTVTKLKPRHGTDNYHSIQKRVDLVRFETRDLVNLDLEIHDLETHDLEIHDQRTHDQGTHDQRTHDQGTHDQGTHDLDSLGRLLHSLWFLDNDAEAHL